jgi:hypothetical protein
MAKSNYAEQAQLISRAIDIAIASVKKFPPKDFSNDHIKHFIDTYLEYKKGALDPEPGYHNMKSLLYIKSDILTYFQESAGKAVEYFWKEVKKNNLELKRENKLKKILKRGKIKNDLEYDFVIDVLVSYQQEGLITEDEANKLNQMIGTFKRI